METVPDPGVSTPGSRVPGSRVPSIELPVVVRFVDLATDALAAAREEIDALNVYPIPDSDTGTNMFLTMSAAREALREAMAVPVTEAMTGATVRPAGNAEVSAHCLRALARGALVGARGNSGVILSQMLGAFVDRMVRTQPGELTSVTIAEALSRASDASYAAVGAPVEGTMLSVARAAAGAADTVAHQSGVLTEELRIRDVFAAAAEAAREALARTPTQLKV
ncbi:MAG: DAK2 domain-containing protein, partial [Nocardioides sp.]